MAARLKRLSRSSVVKLLIAILLISAILTAFNLAKTSNKTIQQLPPLESIELHQRERNTDGSLPRIIIESHKELTSAKSEKVFSKHVLLWHVPFGDVSMPIEYIFEKSTYDIDPSKLSKNGFAIDSSLCGKCSFTFNRSELLTSDAVIFHGLDVQKSDLPAKENRKPGQPYIWWSVETIPHSRWLRRNFELHSVNNYYNWTMSMRRNSDVYIPYSSIPWLLKLLWNKESGFDIVKKIAEVKTPFLTSLDQLDSIIKQLPSSSASYKYAEIPATIPNEIHRTLKKKTRIAAWVVSNCGIATGIPRMRAKLFNELKEAGLRADKFGKCGEKLQLQSRWEPAFHEVLSRYKFYFAMENSYHCIDYMSEKLWYNALYSGTVPIILGPHRSDVEAVLPPKSYIFVEDYPNPDDLVRYLQYLDRNVTAYAEYLRWRSWIRFLDEDGNYDPSNLSASQNKALQSLNENEKTLLDRFASAKPIGFCGLCKRLHENEFERKTIKILNDWIFNDRRECDDEKQAWDMFWSSRKYS